MPPCSDRKSATGVSERWPLLIVDPFLAGPRSRRIDAAASRRLLCM